MNKLPVYRFGNTAVTFSPLSLGTVKFGRNQAVKYPTPFDLPADTEVRELLRLAHEQGITTLDCAPAYGIAEQRLGLLLDARHQWQIIGKAGEFFDNKTGLSHYDFSPKALKTSLEQSLRLLKTDYLDCWLLHSDGNDIANLNDEVMQTLLDAKQQGWVRSVGASTKTVDGGTHALQHLDGIMMAASLQHDAETALFDIAANLGKGIILKKIYDSGWALNADNKAQVMQQTLAYLFNQSAVATAVVGTLNPKHLQQNIDAWLHRHD